MGTLTNGIGRRAILAGLPLLAAGCGAPSVWADDEFIERVTYRHSGPTALTLFTMKNVGTKNGAHTGLMVNASQRVIFDPAETFAHPSLAERNDVIYGISPTVLDFYRTYHARSTYFVVEQYVEVSPRLRKPHSGLSWTMDLCRRRPVPGPRPTSCGTASAPSTFVRRYFQTICSGNFRSCRVSRHSSIGNTTLTTKKRPLRRLTPNWPLNRRAARARTRPAPCPPMWHKVQRPRLPWPPAHFA